MNASSAQSQQRWKAKLEELETQLRNSKMLLQYHKKQAYCSKDVMDIIKKEIEQIETAIQDCRAKAESEARKHGLTEEEINKLSSHALFDFVAAEKQMARRCLGSDADSSDDDDTEPPPTNRQAEEARKTEEAKSVLGKRKASAREPVVQNLAQSKKRKSIQNACMQEVQNVMKTVSEQMNNVFIISMESAMENAKERMNNIMQNANEQMKTAMENAMERMNAMQEEANVAMKNATEQMDPEVKDVTDEMRRKQEEELEKNKIDLSTPIEDRLVEDAAKYGVTLEANKLKNIGIEKLHNWYRETFKFNFKNWRRFRKQAKENIFLAVFAKNKKEIYDSMKKTLFPEKKVEDYRIKYKDCVGKRILHESGGGAWIVHRTSGVITNITKSSIHFKVDGSDTIKTVRENFTIDKSKTKERKPMEWEKIRGYQNAQYFKFDEEKGFVSTDKDHPKLCLRFDLNEGDSWDDVVWWPFPDGHRRALVIMPSWSAANASGTTHGTLGHYLIIEPDEDEWTRRQLYSAIESKLINDAPDAMPDALKNRFLYVCNPENRHRAYLEGICLANEAFFEIDGKSLPVLRCRWGS